MIARSVLPGLTVRLRIEALESHSPASSLLDLAYLGLAATGRPFADAQLESPFAGIRPGLVAEEGFDRPHTWAVPADAGKMADTQTVAVPASPSAERRGDWLEIDTPADRPPVFVLPATAPPPSAPPADTPTSTAPAVGAADTAGAVTPPTLPAFLTQPAPRLPAKGESRLDPDVPSLPSSSYTTGPAPGGYVSKMRVQEVDFQSDILVKADPGRTRYPSEGGRPEWRDADLNGLIVDAGTEAAPTEWSVPVAYVRGARPVVKATFVIQERNGMAYPTVDKNVVTIQGLWQGDGAGLLLPPLQVPIVDGQGGAPATATYPFTATKGELGDYVDSVRSASIAWQFQRPGTNTWVDAGVSGNEMFVTLAAPAGTVHHTLISLSTRASWGASDAKTVVNKTYEQFTFRTIRSVLPAYMPPGSVSATDYGGESRPLHYYKNWLIGKTTTAQLLQYGDGQCRAWTRFFTDSVQMHGGIPVETRRVTPADPNGIGDKLFAVTLWNFTDHKTFPRDVHPYANVVLAGVDPRQRNESMEWEYQWHVPPDVQDFEGSGGQNVQNPSSLFDSHFIVAYDDGVSGRKLYDPSYGTGPFTSFSAWEHESVSALVGRATVTGGDNKNYDLYLFRPNLGAADLREDPAL